MIFWCLVPPCPAEFLGVVVFHIGVHKNVIRSMHLQLLLLYTQFCFGASTFNPCQIHGGYDDWRKVGKRIQMCQSHDPFAEKTLIKALNLQQNEYVLDQHYGL
jgi:hypothetical protein